MSSYYGTNIRVNGATQRAEIKLIKQCGQCDQSGTPTPTAPAAITGRAAGAAIGDGVNTTTTLTVTDANGNPITLYGIPVASGGNVTIDGQQYISDTIEESTLARRIRVRVLDGTENIESQMCYGRQRFQINLTFPDYVSPFLYEYGYCTHFEYSARALEYAEINNACCGISSVIYFYADAYADVQAFTSFLSAQYAAGTPVTICHVRLGPDTETVTISPKALVVNSTTATWVSEAWSEIDIAFHTGYSEAFNIFKSIKEFQTSAEFDGYSKVVINVTDELSYEAGNTTGRTLTMSCPWGTQQMANNILSSLQGFQYQPYTAEGALLDPAAELGDGVTVNGVYSGIYTLDTTFGQLCAAGISAPTDEEIDHEYPFETVADRQIIRKFAETSSEFKVQANQIAAKVEKVGGSTTSFGWTLTEDGFILASNGREVFRADGTGITVRGKIQADEGYIGGEGGFTIKSNAIYNGVLSVGDTAHYGVYIGTDGITLGKGAFRVDSGGNLYAQSGTFEGNIYARNIQVGGSAGYVEGYQVGGGTLGSYNCDGYVTSGLGNGYYSYDCLNDNQVAGLVSCYAIRIYGDIILGWQRYSPAVRYIEGYPVLCMYP